MKSETGSDASSIPPSGIATQDLLTEAVGSAPVRVRAYGLSVSADATVVERETLIVRLLDGESRVSCPFRLCIGDVWNQTPPRTKARKELALRLKARLGANYYDTIRRYGWVAGMWPEHLRGGKRVWAQYLKGPDGKLKAPRAEKVHEWIRRETVDEGEVFYCERADGTAYTVRVVEKAVKP